MAQSGRLRVSERLRGRCAAAIALAVVVSLSPACASDDSATSTQERPLTAEEAGRLSRVLTDNLSTEGASFTLISSTPSTGETIQLVGDISWTDIRGRADVSATGPEAATAEVYWSEVDVLERRPSLIERAREADVVMPTWVARPPDPEGRTLDSLLALLTGLASPNNDNPLLVQQNPGSAFLRMDAVDGRPVEVLRYGRTLEYWLSTDDGTLLRFEADTVAGTRPVVVTFGRRGPTTITGPEIVDVVSIDEVRELFEADLDAALTAAD